ncbi:MAG: NTP transferase domain-containing protein [bacterium]
MIKQAVILAAGNGSRIQRSKADVPKPLRKVCGLTLIKRSILTAKQAGVTDFVIVVGYKGEQIIEALSKDESLGVRLQFVTNSDYHKANGVSVLAAKPFVHKEFLLMMADHIFDKQALQKIVKESLSEQPVLLGIDRNMEEIFDLEDVTKVKVVGDQIVEIGKHLSDYNAYDTGIFACNASLFEALESVYQEKGDVSLSDGIRALAAVGRAGVSDLTDCFWQDVDTPEALRHAEKHLFQSLRKPTDGWISSRINRPISMAISRILVKTPITANQVTFLVTLVGIMSGVFVATGKYLDVVIGGVLFQMASILDGCDGEISKLKMTSSKTGEWLDTISDNITYLVFLVGVSMGSHRILHGTFEVFEAAFMLVGLAFLLVLLVFYLLYHANSGTLTTIQKDLKEEDKKSQSAGGAFSWASKINFLMKRDFFALFFMLLCVIDQLPLILHLSFVGVNLTWMVILAYKRDIFKVGDSKVKVVEPN